MRERLIELIVNADTYDEYECKLCAKDDDACDCCYAEKLADYLLANGVIVPPCKVGDTVWFETFKKNGAVSVGIQPHTIDRVDIDFVVGAKKLVETKIPDFRIGKTVFLTREEAEQALEDMRKE